jgi:signal transduction histidine kinase
MKSKKNTLIIYIEDQGMGILENDIERIFEPFYRGKNQQVFGST